ncbi:MAG: hypothetical protein ACK44W_05515 [Planctomycetota bacterium]
MAEPGGARDLRGPFELLLGSEDVHARKPGRLDRLREGAFPAQEFFQARAARIGQKGLQPGAAEFRVGELGFDFGALGRLDVPSVTARVRPAGTSAQTPEGGPQVGPRRFMAMRTPQQRMIFGTSDPVTLATFASGPSLQQLSQVTPTGAP